MESTSCTVYIAFRTFATVNPFITAIRGRVKKNILLFFSCLLGPSKCYILNIGWLVHPLLGNKHVSYMIQPY